MYARRAPVSSSGAVVTPSHAILTPRPPRGRYTVAKFEPVCQEGRLTWRTRPVMPGPGVPIREIWMRDLEPLRRPLLLLATLLVLGALGYMVIEGFSLLDAIYM